MKFNLLERLWIHFQRFNSDNAANPELRGLTHKAAIQKIAAHRNQLLEDYVSGAISGYQCRVMLNDYIRDSIRMKDELAIISQHQKDVAFASFDREVPLEENEILHSITSLISSLRRQTLNLEVARDRLHQLIRLEPPEKRIEWQTLFSDLCKKYLKHKAEQGAAANP